MTLLISAALILVTFSLLPIATRSRLLESASPGALAAADLLGLGAWALLPTAATGCLVVVISAAAAGGHAHYAGVCWLGLNSRDWTVLGGALATLLLAPLLLPMIVEYRRLRAGRLRSVALFCAERVMTESGQQVLVFPTDVKVAFSVGFLAPQAVVSRGALVGLSSEQARAVLEHEAAHTRLGHARLLVLAAAVEGAYGRLPPVRWLTSGLRRELEAVADRQALRFVGRGAVLRALLAMGESHSAHGVESAASDPEHIRYRIRRLTSGPGRHLPATVGTATLVAALAALLASSLCTFLAGHPTPVGLVLCLAAISLPATWTACRSAGGLKPRPRSPT